MCWTRQEYGAKSGLLSAAAIDPPLNYYSWTATATGGCAWRFVLLDAFDVAVPVPPNFDLRSSAVVGGWPAEHPNTIAGRAVLLKHNPNVVDGGAGVRGGVNWGEGLAGEARRFMPYGGGLGAGQLVRPSAWGAGSCPEAGLTAAWHSTL
jgi:hypothetical protein